MLASSGKTVEERFAAAPERDANFGYMRHIVGMERWGQHRLRVALGEPLVVDESDDYYPSAEIAWPELRVAFSAARTETLAISRQIVRIKALDAPVPHNQFGPLSARGWLRYLAMHAALESMRLR